MYLFNIFQLLNFQISNNRDDCNIFFIILNNLDKHLGKIYEMVDKFFQAPVWKESMPQCENSSLKENGNC